VNRVVIDTNVLVSALLFGGRPGRLRDLWQSRSITPLATAEIVDEYLRVLAYPKFSLSEEEIHFLMSEEILPLVEIVSVPERMPSIAPDPSDDKFIRCAEVGEADAVVSGDAHLLNLTASPVPIVSVAEFLGGR